MIQTPTPEPVNSVFETRHCTRCNAPFQVEIENSELGRLITGWRKFCGPCADLRNAEIEQERAEKDRREHEARWQKVCPPAYADTDLHYAGLSQTFLRAAAEWDVNSTKGLGFIGATGAGKTRCLFVAMRRAFDDGASCRYLTHNAFSKLVLAAFTGDGEARKEAVAGLAWLGKVDVLLIDDLGKAPATERADAELEEIVETRCAHQLPLLWSSNAGGEWLSKRLGADRGEPLVRRLAEFTTVIRG